MHYGIDKFCIAGTKLITNIELQYYVNLKANFNLNKLKNLSIQFAMQSIISIQPFFSVMGWKRPSKHFQNCKCFIYVKIWFFCLIHKVDLCLANLNLQKPKWFATYSVNIMSRNKYTWFHTNVTMICHDLPWSNARMISFKCCVENVLKKRTDWPIL